MIFSLIAAIGENRELGLDNRLPWHLPADTAYFKQMILDKPVMMGRLSYQNVDAQFSTYKNVILSRSSQLELEEGFYQAYNLEEALELLKDENEVFVLGGASLYEKTLPIANYLYLTHIRAAFKADSFFPEIPWEDWEQLQAKDYSPDQENRFSYTFAKYTRLKA